MQRFYMVLNTKTGYTKERHNDYNVALNEARRLAAKHPGDELLVLMAVATAKKVDVIVDELDQPDKIMLRVNAGVEGVF